MSKINRRGFLFGAVLLAGTVLFHRKVADLMTAVDERPMIENLPVLMYHGFYDENVPKESIPKYRPTYHMNLELFKEQIDFLKKDEWQTIKIEELVGHMISGEPFSKKTLALTFDDGLKSAYTAAELLYANGQTGTFSLYTKRINHPGGNWLNWDQAYHMLDMAMDIQGHSHSHGFGDGYVEKDAGQFKQQAGETDEEYRLRVRRELSTCKQIMYEHGIDIGYHAFVCGSTDRFSDIILPELKKLGYKGAMTCAPSEGITNLGGNPYLIPRLTMSDDEDLRTLEARLHS